MGSGRGKRRRAGAQRQPQKTARECIRELLEQDTSGFALAVITQSSGESEAEVTSVISAMLDKGQLRREHLVLCPETGRTIARISDEQKERGHRMVDCPFCDELEHPPLEEFLRPVFRAADGYSLKPLVEPVPEKVSF